MIELIESVTRAERLLLLLVTAVLLPAAQALGDERYTVFMELEPPYAGSRAAVRKMLAQEGYAPYREGSREVALVLTARQLSSPTSSRQSSRRASPGTSGASIWTRSEAE